MVESYALWIKRQLTHDEFKQLLSHVSEEKQRRIRQFYFFSDAQRALLGDLLARHAVCTRAGVRHDQIRIGLNPYRKPVLVYPENLCFNISHTEDWVVCAVDHDPVGIDVECIKPINLEIAERFFSTEECMDLLSRNEASLVKHFYRIWTLKESYIKMIGKGLSIPLHSFTIRIFEDSITLQHDTDENMPSYFRQDDLADSIVSICAKNKLFGALNLLELEDLILSFSEEKSAEDRPKRFSIGCNP